MRLTDLIAPLHARLVGSDAEFTKLSTDSRQLQPGELFVALRGDNFDGHDFVQVAVDRGACALVVEQDIESANVPQVVVADSTRALGAIGALSRKAFSGTIVAVTGSSGKTSVKGLLRDIFATAADVVATQGNFNNYIGVPLTLMNLSTQRFAVVEIGTNHPGEIAYLTDLVKPDIALVNNVGPAHIGGFGSIEAIAREKGSIYGALQAHQTAVINLDDAFAEQFLKATQQCRQIGFSLAKSDRAIPAVYAQAIEFDSVGRASFALCYQGEMQPVRLLLPGQHNVANALAAAACAIAAGVNLSDIAAGLGKFSGEKGRMQIYDGPRGARIVDDTYNANPASVRAAIDYLSNCPGNRVLVLGDLGELGETAPAQHRELGRYAAQKNISVLLTHGPLSALSAAEFGTGGLNFPSKEALVDALLSQLDAHTTALVKGSRSARMEEIVQRVLNTKEVSSC